MGPKFSLSSKTLGNSKCTRCPKNVPGFPKMYQVSQKCIKCPKNVPGFPKMYQVPQKCTRCPKNVILHKHRKNCIIRSISKFHFWRLYQRPSQFSRYRWSFDFFLKSVNLALPFAVWFWGKLRKALNDYLIWQVRITISW